MVFFFLGGGVCFWQFRPHFSVATFANCNFGQWIVFCCVRAQIPIACQKFPQSATEIREIAVSLFAAFQNDISHRKTNFGFTQTGISEHTYTHVRLKVRNLFLFSIRITFFRSFANPQWNTAHFPIFCQNFLIWSQKYGWICKAGRKDIWTEHSNLGFPNCECACSLLQFWKLRSEIFQTCMMQQISSFVANCSFVSASVGLGGQHRKIGNWKKKKIN